MFAITRFRYIEVLFHIFDCYWDEEYHSLYWGLRYREVCYIEVPLYVCYNEVSLYRGSFSYIWLLLGWRISFVIPRTSLYRDSLYRGSTVIFFASKGAIYFFSHCYGDLCAHVKITCYFYIWRYHASVWKLTWHFIGVF